MSKPKVKSLKENDRFLNEMVQQYLTTLLWASNDLDSGEPLDDNYSIKDISSELKRQTIMDCKKFIQMAGDIVYSHDAEQLGHDFFLTREGHGSGFWDGDYDKDAEEIFMSVSKKFKEVQPYNGDDGKIYGM